MISIGKVLLPAYIALAALAYFFQDGLIFFPQPRSEEALIAVRIRHPLVEEVRVRSDDGVPLHGWYLGSRSAANGERAPLIVYYGGNAEEVSGQLDEAGRFAGYSLLAVNYRGYGGSGGEPSESALFADALKVFDYALSRGDVDGRNMVIMGRSLGTGVAVHVAARREVRAVLLVSPYDSMIEVGRSHHPYLPVSLLLRHRFEAISDAPRIKAPLLALVAPGDNVVPNENSRRLVAAWGGPHRLREIAGATHNLFGASPEYWRDIAAFLSQFREGSLP
ncbi:MAG: alpha/beta hydrolase [Burkholderiales bacterium]